MNAVAGGWAGLRNSAVCAIPWHVPWCAMVMHTLAHRATCHTEQGCALPCLIHKRLIGPRRTRGGEDERGGRRLGLKKQEIKESGEIGMILRFSPESGVLRRSHRLKKREIKENSKIVKKYVTLVKK